MSDATRRSKIYSFYDLLGDLDPDRITDEVGVQPAKTSRKGEWTSARKAARWRESGWRIRSTVSDDLDKLQPSVESVLEQLRPGWSALTALGKVYRAYLTSVVYSYEFQGPLLSLDANVMRQLAELNADFGIDLYCEVREEDADL